MLQCADSVPEAVPSASLTSSRSGQRHGRLLAPEIWQTCPSFWLEQPEITLQRRGETILLWCCKDPIKKFDRSSRVARVLRPVFLSLAAPEQKGESMGPAVHLGHHKPTSDGRERQAMELA